MYVSLPSSLRRISRIICRVVVDTAKVFREIPEHSRSQTDTHTHTHTHTLEKQEIQRGVEREKERERAR